MCQIPAQECTFIFSFYFDKPGEKTLVATFLGVPIIQDVPLASIPYVLSIQ